MSKDRGSVGKLPTQTWEIRGIFCLGPSYHSFPEPGLKNRKGLYLKEEKIIRDA